MAHSLHESRSLLRVNDRHFREELQPKDSPTSFSGSADALNGSLAEGDQKLVSSDFLLDLVNIFHDAYLLWY